MAVPVPGISRYVCLNLFLFAADGQRPSNQLFFWTFHYFMVKSLFGTQDLFMSSLMGNLQVLLTRLALVAKMLLFLKLPDFEKNKLVAFHSLWNKESDFYAWEMCKSGDDLDSFSAIINWQLMIPTVVNCRQRCRNILPLGSETYSLGESTVGGNQPI
jgi:hypothetical protein